MEKNDKNLRILSKIGKSQRNKIIVGSFKYDVKILI